MEDNPDNRVRSEGLSTDEMNLYREILIFELAIKSKEVPESFESIMTKITEYQKISDTKNSKSLMTNLAMMVKPPKMRDILSPQFSDDFYFNSGEGNLETSDGFLDLNTLVKEYLNKNERLPTL